MKVPDIDELDIILPNQPPRKIGFRHSGHDIYLYLLEQDKDDRHRVQKLSDMIHFVQEQCFPNTPVHDLNWHIRSRYTTSDVTFKPDAKGETQRMDISNLYAAYTFPATLDEYRQDKFGEFQPPQHVLEIPSPQDRHELFILKGRDGKEQFFKHETNSNPTQDAVVYIDAQKFVDLIRKYAPHQEVPKDKALRDWPPGGTNDPQPLTKIGCFQHSNGMVEFSMLAGSASQLMSLYHSGVQKIPVAIDRQQVELLRALSNGTVPQAKTRPGARM